MKTFQNLFVAALMMSTFFACTQAGKEYKRKDPSIMEQLTPPPVENGENDSATITTQLIISGSKTTNLPNCITGNDGYVGGGFGNSAGEGSTICGGVNNQAPYFFATIGGGRENNATGPNSTIGGGHNNTSSGRRSTIGGGAANTASDLDTTIGGGSGNTASYRFSTIGGGTENLASGLDSVISGGANNQANGVFSSVLGGVNNQAIEIGSTVNGGAGNLASGVYAVIPGGFANQAGGDYSFAAGREASILAEHGGTFLFADSIDQVFTSQAKNEFAVRSTGGARFVTDADLNGNTVSGAQLRPRSNGWETMSVRNATREVSPEERGRILEQLMNVPIHTWSYGDQGATVRHMGVGGEEFHTTFKLGENNGYTSTGDLDGIALASIQGLYEIIDKQRLEIAHLQAEKSDIEERVGELESRIEALDETMANENDGGEQNDATSNTSWMMGLGLVAVVGWVVGGKYTHP